MLKFIRPGLIGGGSKHASFSLGPAMRIHFYLPTLLLFFIGSSSVLVLQAETTSSDSGTGDDAPLQTDVPAGHSFHGDFLNEGPRQEAYLMRGTGVVDFPVTTSHDLVRKFCEQGLGQIYGFWFLEAERSFRQALTLDPDCAAAYWGAALATLHTEKRAKGFIDEAIQRKDQASEREQKYIEALHAYIELGEEEKKKRAEEYTQALEDIALEFPEDLEAKALLALQLYRNRQEEIKGLSHLAIDALLNQIFQKQPMHSAHHFRIHLWDNKKPELALNSAALCGQLSPAIAHMWHMPGHIYSRLKRYEDACWQQEASARVDHAHMMRDRVLPDEIHNFAHNNEWFIRNMNHVGRVRDAVDLAKNMITLPRHPRFNTLQKKGSAYYGRSRLFETLSRYELWDEMIELCHSNYLEPTDDFKEQVKRLRHLGTAYFHSGCTALGETQLNEILTLLEAEKGTREKTLAEVETKARQEAIDEALVDQAAADAEAKSKQEGADEQQMIQARCEAAEESRQEQLAKNSEQIAEKTEQAGKDFDSKIEEAEQATYELKSHLAMTQEDYGTAVDWLEKAKGDGLELAWAKYLAEESETALKDAQQHVDEQEQEVQPRARLVELYWRAGQREDAKKAFEVLRESSASIDMDLPIFQRLAPIAAELELPVDWRIFHPPASDLGQRPDLATLGPFRWQPSLAADGEVQDSLGKGVSLEQFRGRPMIVIFYLGVGCLHCVEQLHAFAEDVDSFKAAGIDVIAVSTDTQEKLKQSIDNYDAGELPIELFSDSNLDVFKTYRCYDDFEKQPLHGTFLMDSEGLVLWQDIGYEPFMDLEFLLGESQRLLGQR